tara:strand:+ start:884 stop:3343 length:2460 start_codon:yes stop_codon:yes gene_type:complete
MPKISRKHNLHPDVVWDGVSLFTKLIANSKPTFAVFPKGKNKACIHIKGGTADTTKNILNILERKPDNSLGVILGVAKPQPDDWGTKKEHLNSAGYPRAWGASDSHIDYLNVFVVEGDPEDMDLATQKNLIKKAGLPDYSFGVDSGNRSLHAYWLAEKVPPDKWKNIQQRLIQLLEDKVPELKVDTSIKNPARVMRCVGGRHSKTNKFCEFFEFNDFGYSWEDFDKLLPPLREKKNTPIYKKKKFTLEKIGADKGWLDRLKDQPEVRREYVVEMFKVLPIHEGAGKGRRGTICIPCLAGLVNEYGNEAISICNDAGWYGSEWDPSKEVQYLQDHQDCDLGTVIWWARKYGWEYSPKQKKSNIKVADIFPTEVSNSINTVTAYLPHKDSLKILTFMSAVAPLIRLGTKINCIPTTNFIVPLNLFACVIGASGSKKTPLMNLLLQEPLKEVKKDLARANFKAGQQYVLDLADYKNNGGDKPEKPPYPIITTRDATTEALEKQLMDQERVKMGLLRFNDELAGLIKSFGAYKQGKGGDEEFLLELYDGSGFQTSRMDENRYCEETAVTIFGGGQPEVLTKLHRGQDANGLWARFIFDYSAAIPKRLPTVVTTEERSKFKKAESYLRYFISEVKDFRTNTLELTEEALKRFSDYELERQELAAKKNLKSSHAATYNKSAGKVARVAGILWIKQQVQLKIKNKISQGDSYVDEPPDNQVDISTINNAIELVNYWDSVSINVDNKASENSRDIILRRLLDIAAKSKGPVPFSDIYKKLSFDHRKKYQYEEVKELIKKLEELGLGSVSKGPREGYLFKAEKPWPTG